MDDPFVWGGEEEPRTESELHTEGDSPVAENDEDAEDDSSVSTIAEGDSLIAENDEDAEDDSSVSTIAEESTMTLNERVYKLGKDAMEIMNERDTLTGTFGEFLCPAMYPPAAFATKHKRCLLLHTEKTKSIILSEYDNDTVLAYWNETLKGYVIRPTRDNVKELCEWLDHLNEGCDRGDEYEDDYSEERPDEDYDF